ncbi:DUF2905 family protein [Candidatus Daviesbacteria bacterium]|nr:DUF2905 family protein [Candidatus Daviesbacteria bacterium]
MKLLKKIWYDLGVTAILHGIYILIGTFGILTLIFNFEPNLPRFPWDMIVDKFGFRLYFPVTTAFVAAILLLTLFKLANFNF